MKSTIVVAITALWSSIATPASAGVSVNFGSGSVKIQGGKFRSELRDPEGDFVIVHDTDKKRIIVWAVSERVYTTASLAKACKLTKPLLERAKSDADRTTSPDSELVPFDTGSGYVSAGKRRFVNDVQLTRGRWKNIVAGEPVRNYEIWVNDELYAEFSVTQSAKVRKATQGISWSTMRRFNSCGVGVATVLTSNFSDEHPENHPKVIDAWSDGALVRVSLVKEGAGDEAKSIEVEEISKSEFQPPKGYKKIPFRDALVALAKAFD